MVKVPEVVVRKTIRKVKGSTDIDQQIDEVHELLAQATIKLKGLEERKKEKKKEEEEEYEEVEYVYHFRGPQPPKGGGPGSGGFGFYGGGASMR